MLRKACIASSAVLILYLMMELVSLGFYYYRYGEAFSFAAVNAKRAEVIRQSAEYRQKPVTYNGSLGEDHYVAHPYAGYVHDSSDNSALRRPYGYLAEEDPFLAGKDPRNAIVGISGGSVSEFFFKEPEARDLLRRELQTLPVFRDRKIIFAMFGMGAYRQPQQLLALTYYLSQAGRLDMLLNLDGFNEIVWSNTLAKDDIYPAYPSVWPRFFIDQSSPEVLADLGTLMTWKKARGFSARLFEKASFSVTASTLWSMLDRFYYIRATEAEQALDRVRGGQHPYVMSGPDSMKGASASELTDFVLRLWENSSLQMNHLAQANHFYYFHFLQPNQYVNASKPLTEAEMKQAYNYYSPYRAWVAVTYPLMESALPALHAKGVPVFSLSGIYAQTETQIYIDDCCHVNLEGNRMLARAMGARIREFFAAPGVAGQ